MEIPERLTEQKRQIASLGRLGRFISLLHKYTKKIIYIIVKELRKTIKKSMATGIAQKSCTALFPLWSLRKNDISKDKKYLLAKTQNVGELYVMQSPFLLCNPFWFVWLDYITLFKFLLNSTIKTYGILFY